MIFDNFASKVGEKFEMYQLALAGRYYQDVNASVKVTPKATGDLHKAALVLAQAFVASVRLDVDTMLPAPESRSEINSFMYRVSIIAMECVSTVMKRRRGGERITSIIGDASSGIGRLLQRNATELEFHARDTAGRRWKAATLVKLEARDFAYKLFLKEQVSKILEVSDLAKVVYPNPNHVGFGTIVSISGNSTKYQSLDSLMGTVFHPNSTATLNYV